MFSCRTKQILVSKGLDAVCVLHYISLDCNIHVCCVGGKTWCVGGLPYTTHLQIYVLLEVLDVVLEVVDVVLEVLDVVLEVYHTQHTFNKLCHFSTNVFYLVTELPLSCLAVAEPVTGEVETL